MKPAKIILIAGCLVITTLFCWSISSRFLPAVKKEPVIKSKGFAVVELFTSEGCSSCPAADEVVARIQQENPDNPVYILGFHVDYWNRLGWKDVFSDAAYSGRQRQYADWLHLESVYTPQVVVNGRKELVGSQEKDLRDAIQAGLQQSTGVLIGLKEIKLSNGRQLEMQYEAAGVTRNSSLLVALVQKHAQSVVKSGENGGHTLSHVQIVRALTSMSLKGKIAGSCTIECPQGVDVHGLELIAFLQNERTGEIMGATKSGLENIQ